MRITETSYFRINIENYIGVIFSSVVPPYDKTMLINIHTNCDNGIEYATFRYTTDEGYSNVEKMKLDSYIDFLADFDIDEENLHIGEIE